MVSFTVENRKKKALGDFDVSESTTVEAFKKIFAKKNKKYYPSRQYFTIGTGKGCVRLTDPEKTLGDYGVKAGTTLIFKDLGPQISWTTVFLTEYFGPILIHAIFYYLPLLTGGEMPERHWVQKLAFFCVVFHYVKRELETIFVHRFSNGTMPIFNIFKNSAHYWILSGLFIAFPLYHNDYTNDYDENWVYFWTVIFFIGEIGNLSAHITLRNLRPPGTRVRAIPRGGLFEIVSCANYTYELLAWFAFCMFAKVLTSWVFFLASFGQIFIWSLKKHKNYRKEFKDYPRNRKSLIPFIA